MEGYIAEIRMFAANFAPKYWSYCQGQTLSIAQNQALFSLLGTQYGGNGVTTFSLPNFSSRTALGTGSGGGLPTTVLGQVGGTESVALTINQIPSHSHTTSMASTTSTMALQVLEDGSSIANPSGAVSANGENITPYQTAQLGTEVMGSSPVTIGGAMQLAADGGNQPHNNIQPSLGMNYVICLYGIFPSRN